MAFFASIFAALALAPSAQAQAQRGVVEQLVQQATQLVQERYSRPLGRVAERKRDRVSVLLRQVPPPAGTLLEVVRPASGRTPEQIVARIEIVQTVGGVTECREKERTGRAHAESGDIVRRPVGKARLLLAPCVSLVDLAPEIPQVIGEKLREALLRSTLVVLVDTPEAERQAEAAYLSSGASEFVARQTNVDEVLYPVLLQASNKILLNLEYYNVERGRATDIDVANAPIDDMMRAWLRAGRSRQGAPPGYRRLPPQTQPWRVVALGEGPQGTLLAVDPDSVHVLRFEYPGLRVRGGTPLGPRIRLRRDPWYVLVPLAHVQDGEATNHDTYILSDERKPLILRWPQADGMPQAQLAGDIDAVLERLWGGRRQEARWWPAPGQLPDVLLPSFADLDQDSRPDVIWSDAAGTLHLKLATQRVPRSFPGFGDVKALQAPAGQNAAALVWLTDAVWHGEPDRLHEGQFGGDDLQVLWSSEPFEGTIAAVACLDLNADNAPDVVAAEALPEGTRLHAFLAFAGERNPHAPAQDPGARP